MTERLPQATAETWVEQYPELRSAQSGKAERNWAEKIQIAKEAREGGRILRGGKAGEGQGHVHERGERVNTHDGNLVFQCAKCSERWRGDRWHWYEAGVRDAQANRGGHDGNV